ncbi:MAG TPA: YceI family protein [Lacibacter sp.]|nr:YceI family protein [Lacibacter sp.]
MKWLVLFLSVALLAGTPPFTVVYQVDAKNSRLFLNGSTNINTFQCFCNDVFQPATLTGNLQEGSRDIRFTRSRLLIQTNLISCKNKLMNKDLHKALKADEHTHIKLELREAHPLHNAAALELHTWYTYKAKALLTIAGITKPIDITVQLNKRTPTTYRLLASKDILMSEFDVKPRTPFNMIRINDLIVINFDMQVQLH